jgi:TIR domain/Tetratricopeptide repeat
VADIFVSYTSSDRKWAFWIAKELEALGNTAHVHEWEIKGGDDIYAWMEARHDAADHVLCVISDEYLKASKFYSQLERRAALWQAAGNRPGFALLVVVTPCKLPTLSDHIRRCELFGMPEDTARLRFREFMARPTSPDSVIFPGRVFAVSNIPIKVPTHFMGREDALVEIAAALSRGEGRVAITALHGLRGVGKTVLAAAYAERHRSDYRATWWIRAQAEPTMRADLAALAVRLGWVGADEEEALTAVMERLRHEGEGILLIFDNAVDADAIKPYLPRGGSAQVLVTSNAHAWRGVAAPVEIRLWPKEIGADYLVARTGRDGERKAAEYLSEALGGLPLAHEQAAAYCERLEIPLAEYRKRLEAAPARMLDTPRDAPAEYRDKLTVAKTFSIAIEEAVKLHPAAEPLIVYAALLAPEPIPLFLFAEAREKFGEPLASVLAEDGLDEGVAVLRTFALVDRETIVDERDPAITTETIRLHRLVREVAAARCTDDARLNAYCALMEVVTAVYPEEVVPDPVGLPRVRRLDALTEFLVHLEDTDAVPPHDKRGRLKFSVSKFNLSHKRLRANDAEMRQGLRDTLDYLENNPIEPSTGPFLELLFSRPEQRPIRRGEPLWKEGDPAVALPIHKRGLALAEKVLGPEHSFTAFQLNSVAMLLHDLGDFLAARSLYARALAIREKILVSSIPIPQLASATLPCCLRIRANSHSLSRSTRAHWRFSRTSSAPHIPMPCWCARTSARCADHPR